MSKHGNAGTRGNFFSTDIAIFDAILSSHLGWNCAVAYLVLCFGINYKSAHFSRDAPEWPSSHGVTSIEKRAHISKRAAQTALDVLCEQGFIRRATPAEGRPAQGRRRAEGAPKETGPSYFVRIHAPLYLPNELFEGVDHPDAPRSPLWRLAHVPDREERATILRLLLHCYWEQDLGEFGGVDPRSIWREVVAAESDAGEYERELTRGLVMREVSIGDTHARPSFMERVTSHGSASSEDVRREAFWRALDWLLREALVYWTMAVWDRNPRAPGGEFAQPLYTLAIHNRHAEKDEPYLQRDVHRAAMACGALDEHEQFKPLGDAVFHGGEVFTDGTDILSSGRWRYVAEAGDEVFPQEVLRVKYRPKTEDTGEGLEAERIRAERWQRRLSSGR